MIGVRALMGVTRTGCTTTFSALPTGVRIAVRGSVIAGAAGSAIASVEPKSVMEIASAIGTEIDFIGLSDPSARMIVTHLCRCPNGTQ